MSDDELELLRQKRMRELLNAHVQQQSEELKLQQQLQELELIIKQLFAKEALERYGNLKVAHPKKAVQLLVIITQLIQNNRLSGKINDATLKSILQQMEGEKKQTNINKV